LVLLAPQRRQNRLFTMNSTFKKTEQGQAEIQHRWLRLPARLRSLLILVDGKRGLPDLQALLGPDTETALAQLVAMGLVESLGTATPTGSSHAQPSQPAPLSPEPSGGAPATIDFEQLRKTAVRALNDALGPGAEHLAIQMERAATLAALDPLLSKAAQLVANVRGKAAGADYAKRFVQQG
jgi:hypothetical protein